MLRYLLCALLLLVPVVHARGVTDLRLYGQEAPSAIYVFTSPICSHCRDYHKFIWPEIIKNFVETGRARLYVVDIPGTRAGLDAVKMLRCLPPDKAIKVEGWLYENQERWMNVKDHKTVLLQYAQAIGMGTDAFNQCLSNEALETAIVDQSMRLSKLYGVSGTPTTILRHGNNVKYYVGAERKAVLHGLDKDIQDFEKQK